MKLKLLVLALVILSSTSAFARCNGHYADEYIEEYFSLAKGDLRKNEATHNQLGSGKLGEAVGAVCMGGCYMPRTPEDQKSCEVKYRVAVQENIGEAETILKKKADRSKFIAAKKEATCKYTVDVAPTNFDAKAYAAATAKTCSSAGCLPSNLTICRSHVVCDNDPKYGSESYNVSCIGKDGKCPGVMDCMADEFTSPKEEIDAKLMNTVDSKLGKEQ